MNFMMSASRCLTGRKKKDIIDTVSAAKQDVSEKADLDSLLEQAKVQTKALLKGLLSDVIGDRELKIE